MYFCKMNEIENINYWRQKFGFYPLHINPLIDKDQYLMLNGGNHDFCLQTRLVENDITQSYFDYSWSTNTKNFVVLENEKIRIYNWFNKKKIDEFNSNHVTENIDNFYKYLSLNSHKTPYDPIPFILSIFRQLRNLTRSSDSSVALNLLFRLLISLEEEYDKIDSLKWGISDIEIPNNFEYYVNEIKQGIRDTTPKLDLILRHISGVLFQEAHREVIYFDYQLDLFGGTSNKLLVKDLNYSSIHYTPQYIARTIVENSLSQLDLSKKTLKIFDPACGSSEFLVEILKQLKEIEYDGSIKIIGWDTSVSAINTSKFLLQYEKRTQWNNKLDYEVRQVADSLTETWDNDYDLILMNPPFMSWELLKDKKNRDAIIDILGTSFERKRPNIASAFFYKSSCSLNDNGVLGCVLPYSIFVSDVYRTTRREIEDILDIKVIAKLGNYVFEDALTNVSLFIGKKQRSNNSPKLLWSKNEKGIAQEAIRSLRKMDANREKIVEEKGFSIYTPVFFPLDLNSWNIISFKNSNTKKDLDIFLLQGKLSKISDIFKINQGALLGIKNIFKISNEKYNTLSENENIFFRPVITNESIKNSQLKIFEYLWYPYDKQGITITEENELEQIPFAVNILIPNKEVLQRRTGIKEWWGLTRPRNWQFEKEIRLYSNRFGSSNSFAIDTIGNCVIEEGNAFAPKKNFEMNDYYFYLACFSSSVFDSLLSIYSKQIMPGFDLGQEQIKNIPIPNVHHYSIRQSGSYNKLVELGKELEKGNIYVKQVIGDILRNEFYPESI